jgi:hypothetical protein
MAWQGGACVPVGRPPDVDRGRGDGRAADGTYHFERPDLLLLAS